MMRVVVISMVLLFSSGCAGGLRQLPPEPTLYMLTGVGQPNRVRVSSDTVLRITLPRAEPGFDSDGMVYTETPSALFVYRDSRWADAPAQMLTPLLLETLERTGAFRAIVTQPSTGRADYQLDVKLLRLQHEFFDTPSQVRLGLRASLIDNRTYQVLATRSFHALHPAPSENAYGGVQAANAALVGLLTELAEFVVEVLLEGERS